MSRGSLGLLLRCMCLRSRSLLLKIEIQFPLNYLSLHRPDVAKLSILVGYIKRQLRIATNVFVIKVNTTVAKFCYCLISSVFFGRLVPDLVGGSLS